MQEGREPTKRPGTGFVVSDGDVDWQDWNTNSNLDGVPRYKTHFSAGKTPTKGLVQGLLEYPPGTVSAAHWHTPVEVYFVLSGSGVGRIGDETLPIGPGDAVFVSSRVVHAFENTGIETLRVLWTLNCDSVDDIDFHYLD